MKNWKLIVVAVSVLFVAVIVLQNTEEVTTKLLFVEVTMPHAVLLFATFALGFAVGTLFTLRKRQKADQAKAKPKAPS